MITLTPEQERLVAEAVRSGAYSSTREVLDRALETLRNQDAWLHENRDAIHTKIARAAAQLDRGEGIPGEQVPDRLAARKAAWLNKRS